MALNKLDYQSDAVVDLYRAALYLARGSQGVGLDFLKRAKRRIGEELDPEIIALVDKPEKYFKNKNRQLFWAEKILDHYQKLK